MFHLILFIDLYNGVRLSAATVGFSTPVTGLAASRWFGTDEVGIQKMRSIFFERSKSSGVPVTQPAGCGGKSSELRSDHEVRIRYGKYYKTLTSY